MRDRLITLAGALCALLLATALLSPPSPPDYASLPTSVDSGEHGLRLLHDWLEAGNVPVLSSKRRYDELITYAELGDSGNLLIVAEPNRVAAHQLERQALLDWIARGNSLLLLAAHSDVPDWAGTRAQVFRNTDFPLLWDLGFHIAWPEENEAEKDEEHSETQSAESSPGEQEDETLYGTILGRSEEQEKLVPAFEHALLEGVDSVAVTTTGDIHPETAVIPRAPHRGSLPLMHDETGKIPALWRLRSGGGQIWLSRYGDLFGNKVLTEQDNARLAWNIVNLSLGENGSVIFDDMHFGISDIYDPKAFFGDRRLHNTLWFILAFWLIYVVGHGNRLAVPKPRPSINSAAAFVRAVAGLFARRLDKAGVARELFKHFFNDLRRRRGLPTDGKPVWELLEAAPATERALIREARRMYENLDGAKPAKLLLIHNRLTQLRKQTL